MWALAIKITGKWVLQTDMQPNKIPGNVGWSLRYLTVYISCGGMLCLCTNLCIRAVGLTLRQTGWGHTRNDQTSSQICSAECIENSVALFGSQGKHKTLTVISPSKANKTMKGKKKPLLELKKKKKSFH